MTVVTDWDTLAQIFVWTIRTTAKEFNGMYILYDTIRGLKARSPLDSLLAQPSTLAKVPVGGYLKELVKCSKDVHKILDEQSSHVQEEARRAKHRQSGPGTFSSVGDYALARKPPEHGVSARLQAPHLQVVETHGEGADAKAYTLSDLAGKRNDFGFAQPMPLVRLTPVGMLPLAQLSEDTPTRTRMQRASGDKDGTVAAQSLDGKVYVKSDADRNVEECVDIATAKCDWLT